MSQQHKTKTNNTLQFIANWLLFFIITSGALYITSLVLPIFFPQQITLMELSAQLKMVGIGLFSYLKPFITLILFLFFLEWILEKFGINLVKEIRQLTKK